MNVTKKQTHRNREQSSDYKEGGWGIIRMEIKRHKLMCVCVYIYSKFQKYIVQNRGLSQCFIISINGI